MADIKPVEDVFLAVDVQYDFMPGGALAVAHGDEVVPVINRLARAFPHVVLTQDWHPRSHVSFAANHEGRAPFETMTLPYGEQVLWPVHCVQDTRGAALHRDLHVPHARLVIRKGHHEPSTAIRRFSKRTVRHRPVSKAICATSAQDACGSPDWRRTIASRGPRSMRVRRASTSS